MQQVGIQFDEIGAFLIQRVSRFAKNVSSADILTFIYSGAHSFRKGIASFLGGILGGPPTMSIYMRADWSIGLQDRYFWSDAGQDCFVGRCAAGLNFNSTEFGSLPPHFAPGLNVFNGSNHSWSSILPCYEHLPASFGNVLPFLLASLCCHRKFLDETLHQMHPLRSSPVWTCGILEHVSPHIQAGVFENKATGMVATGIPPHVLQLRELAAIQQELRELKSSMNSNFTNLPGTLKNDLLDNFQINGAVPVTMDAFRGFAHEMKELIEAQAAAAQRRGHASGDIESSAAASKANSSLLRPAGFLWADGQYHGVPEKFVLSKYASASVYLIYFR